MMGKDRKDKNKDWTLCYLYYNIYTIWGIRKEKGSIFSLQFLLETFPPHSFYKVQF